MSWSTVVITSRCKLDYKMGFMVVRTEEIKKIFLDEIAILLIENPAVSLTGCLIEALAEKKIRVIFCMQEEHQMKTCVNFNLIFLATYDIIYIYTSCYTAFCNS